MIAVWTWASRKWDESPGNERWRSVFHESPMCSPTLICTAVAYLLMNNETKILQGSLPLAFFPQVFLLLSAQQVPKWKARELQKWRSLTKAKVTLCAPWGSHIPQSSCFWEQGLELIPVWTNASVLAFPCLHLIKSKAENKPNLSGFDGSPTYLQIVLKHAPSKRANYQGIDIKLKHSHAQNCCLAIRRSSKENQVSQN